MQVAENIKEFFHNNGIHSTTIQPEFLDTNGYVIHGDGIESDERERSDKIMNDSDCALTCPKDEEKLEPKWARRRTEGKKRKSTVMQPLRVVILPTTTLIIQKLKLLRAMETNEVEHEQ